MPSSGSEHDRLPLLTSVIAQQYSSATFVPLRFHSRKEELGSPPKTVVTSNFTSFNKMLKRGIAKIDSG